MKIIPERSSILLKPLYAWNFSQLFCKAHLYPMLLVVLSSSFSCFYLFVLDNQCYFPFYSKPGFARVQEEEISKEDAAENAAHLKSLREAIVSTFKQQMRLRRRLMELDSHLLGLALDAERQHAAISHWEARFNRLYKPINMPGSRLSTQQSYRYCGMWILLFESSLSNLC